MADVVGVVFRGGVKVYHFDPAGLEISRGDRVVVQTSSGPEIGQVVEPPHTIEDSELPAPLKKVVRVATGKDLESLAATEDIRRQAMDACRQLIDEHGLDMKLVDADIGFGGEKITFSFFSEERVDFRSLVADLAKVLKRRIELRQVGAREEARMVGGLGPCGRALCCSMFPGDDTPVSIRMAKEQNLPLNPMKISGLCGRLMCCLKYEQEQYVCFRKEAPPKGTRVATLTGAGVVAGYNVTKEGITVRLEDGSQVEVRLSSCEHQEDGSLVVIPEAPAIEEHMPVSWLDSRVGMDRLVMAEEPPDGLPVVEAEIILNENGEPVDVIVAESSRKGRGRRGRGRRRGGHGQGEGGEAARADAASAGATGAGREAAAGTRGNSGGQARPGTRGGSGAGGRGAAGGHRELTQPAGARSGGGRGGPAPKPADGDEDAGGGSGGRRRRHPSQPAEHHERRPHGGQGGAAEAGHAGPAREGGEGGGEQAGPGSDTRRRRRRPRRPGGGQGGGAEGGSGGGASAGGGAAE